MNAKLLAIPAIGAGGFLAWYYFWRMPPLSPQVQAILTASPLARSVGYGGVSPKTRLANAQIIVQEFMAANVPVGIALAAVANANHESALNHLVIGDVGKSVGLFQLHESGGGKGMSVADRQDPHLNTRRIIAEYNAAKNATSGRDLSRGSLTVPMRSLMTAYAQGASVAEMAGLFGFHVERPYDLQGALSDRSQEARTLFPTAANQPANSIV